MLTEALPYRETRNYVRKILVSALYYGYLYHDQDPRDIVAAFYPTLED